MEANYPEINLGATICERLRTIYHPDKPWVDCYKEIAQKLTELKANSCKFYTDKTEIEILMELCKYNDQDLMEMFHVEHGKATECMPNEPTVTKPVL